MKKWLLALLLLLVLIVPCAQADETASKPFAVVLMGSYDRMSGDLNDLCTLFGQPLAKNMAEGALSGYSGSTIPRLLDRQQPIGAALYLDGETVEPILFLPTSKASDVIRGFAATGIREVKQEDGISKLVLPNQEVFFKQQPDFVFLARTADRLKANLPAPRELAGEWAKPYNFAVQFLPTNIPIERRQQFADMIIAKLDEAGKAAEQSNPGNAALTAGMQQYQKQQIQQLLTEVQEFTFGLGYEAPSHVFMADVNFEPLANSKMAAEVKEYLALKSELRNYQLPGALASLFGTTKLPPEQVTQLKEAMEPFKQKALETVDKDDQIPQDKRPNAKAVIENLFVVASKTLELPKIDFGAAADYTSGRGLDLLLQGNVAELARLEDALKELANLRQFEVKWDAEKVGDVRFHSFTLPNPNPDPAGKLLIGDSFTIWIGFGPQHLYVSLGKDLDLLKRVQQNPPSQSNSISEGIVSMKKIFMIARDVQVAQGRPLSSQERMVGELVNLFGDQSHLRLSVFPSAKGGIQVRYLAEGGIVLGIAEAAKKAQLEAAQGR